MVIARRAQLKIAYPPGSPGGVINTVVIKVVISNRADVLPDVKHRNDHTEYIPAKRSEFEATSTTGGKMLKISLVLALRTLL